MTVLNSTIDTTSGVACAWDALTNNTGIAYGNNKDLQLKKLHLR